MIEGKKPRKPRAPREPSAVQQKLIDGIMEGDSPTKAAIERCGQTTSTMMMRSETVKAALAEARKEIADATTLKRLDVIEIVMEAIDMARTLADPAQMINGADKLAKIMGYYQPETLKLEVSKDSNVLSSKFRQMSDEELLEIAAGRAKVIDGECEVLQ